MTDTVESTDQYRVSEIQATENDNLETQRPIVIQSPV